MVTDDEKKNITEKVQFENEMKQQATGFSWFTLLNSKLALLFVGAILTGILVPSFQHFQEKREWRRRTLWAKTDFRLEKMRACLREVTYLHAYGGEAYEMVEPFLETDSFDNDDYEAFEQQFLDLQKRRFRQNATVQSLIIYYANASDLDKLFKAYKQTFHRLMTAVKTYMMVRNCRSNPSNCSWAEGDKADLDSIKMRIRESIPEQLVRDYESIIGKMKQDIKATEDLLHAG